MELVQVGQGGLAFVSDNLIAIYAQKLGVEQIEQAFETEAFLTTNL